MGYRTFRLPTESEWEYACRMGTTMAFYWDEDSNYSQIGDYAWYSGNSGSRTHEIGTKEPNGFGLFDMSGNVWEWCQDWYDSYLSGHQYDPTGKGEGSNRVKRGGSWNNNARNCRSANRNRNNPDNRNNNIGFRLAFSRTPREKDIFSPFELARSRTIQEYREESKGIFPRRASNRKNRMPDKDKITGPGLVSESRRFWPVK